MSPKLPLRTADIPQLAGQLFREEAGKLVSVLTGLFGLERLQMAEDVVQEALVRALQTWPFYGVPDNPAAWLTQTAKRLALDLLRREQNFRGKQDAIIAHLETWIDSAEEACGTGFDTEIRDDRLRLLFACCHPRLPEEAQTALALKTLCGLGTAEIAKAFLSTEAAMAKRLVRARQSIRDERIPFEIPAGDELPRRLDGVLRVVYLLFNEGYKASTGSQLVREDLCHEAIRLAGALAEHPLTDRPRTHALLSLMLLTAARLPARQDGRGHIVRMEEQDRALWDRALIGRGLRHLTLSSAGGEVSEYHLQAGIAACHSTAPDYAVTDWPQIVALYDELLVLDPSPVVALNRAIALSRLEGPAGGLTALEAIDENTEALQSYYLYQAVRAEFEGGLGRFESAARCLRRALELVELASERELLLGRLRECERQATAARLVDRREAAL